MDFLQAVRRCMTRYATFGGRAGRKEFWFFQLFYVLALLAMGLVDDAAGTEVASGITILALLPPQLAVASRRLHDMDRSAAWLMLVLLPFFGTLALAVICAWPADPYPNRYGPPALA